MFINHTDEDIFYCFEHRYEENLLRKYPHISNVHVHCLYPEQYIQLKNVPVFDCIYNDPFAYSCNRKDGTNLVEFYIVFSPSICYSLNLDTEEIYAGIAHELGHIIHYFNATLKGQPEILYEMKADEVVAYLGLSLPLSNLLSKLIASNKFTEYQEQSMKKRIMLL